MMKLLEGVRVLDLTNVIAGPLATYHLALCGAEVIKIEAPGNGDLARKMGADLELSKRQMGVSFLAMNAGKKSMIIDLKTEGGKHLFKQLVRGADVVVENFRPGTMAGLGLGYEVLREQNDSIVYCAISGFGQHGPLAKRPCYDQIVQGFSGLMSVTGTTETAPTRAGYVVCDTISAISAAFAIAAALVRRGKSGRGEMIDVSMLDVSLSTMASWPIGNYLNAGVPALPMGNENLTASPSGTFHAADGLIIIVNNEQKQFERLAEAIDMPHLLSDQRFATREARLQYRGELTAILESRLRTNTVSHWEEILVKAGVPVGPVINLEQALDHPQIKERGTVQWMDAIEGVGRPFAITGLGFCAGDGSRPDAALPPPRLGEHTRFILQEAGFTDLDIQVLHEQGAIHGEGL